MKYHTRTGKDGIELSGGKNGSDSAPIEYRTKCRPYYRTGKKERGGTRQPCTVNKNERKIL